MIRLILIPGFAAVAGAVWFIGRWIHRSFLDISTDIDLQEIPGFLSRTECDQWVAWIQSHPDRFEPSEVDRGWFGNRDQVYRRHRQSNQCWLDACDHPLAMRVSLYANQTLYAYLKGALYHEELLQVVQYAPGGYFRPHYDERASFGSYGRHATLIVYLNDDYAGGETVFPRLSRTVVPKKGKAVLFKNTNPTTHRCLWKSLHEGRPVVSGEKYILNLWIHLKK